MLISKFDTENIEAKVQELEGKYEITLPEQYREFLLKYNGGETPQTEFKIGREDSDVRAFFGLGDVAYSMSEEADLEDLVKKQLLPIATDSFGNYITIGIGKKNYGKIYFCDHERGYKATLLTKDLKEFVSRCKSKKIGKILSIEEREQKLIESGTLIIEDYFYQMWQAEIDKYSNIKQERVIIK